MTKESLGKPKFLAIIYGLLGVVIIVWFGYLASRPQQTIAPVINPATEEFCGETILENCDSKKVNITGKLEYIAKGPIPILTNIENREVMYVWAGGVFLVWSNGGIPNTISGTNINIIGKVSAGGQLCGTPERAVQCLAPYYATQIEVESFNVINNTEGVIITTDKTEYEQGETIKIVVNNGLDKSILYSGWGGRFWDIEYYKDGNWINPNNGFQLTKKNVGETCSILLYERSAPEELTSRSNLAAQWNQKICPLGTEGPDKPKIVRYIESGKYRLAFSYGFEISSKDSFQISEPKKVYSNEFTIKEKTAVSENQLKFETIEKENYSSNKERKNYIINNINDWKDLLRKLTLDDNSPKEYIPVDFTKDIIIAVFQGEKSTGGYDIEINKIMENENTIEVSITEIFPGLGCMVTEAFTSPYHIVKLQKSAKEIVFNIAKEVTDCR